MSSKESPSLLRGPEWPGIKIYCTTRTGGVSVSPYQTLNLATHVGDNPDAVDENRRRVRALVPQEPCWLEQVHGVGVYDADQPPALTLRDSATREAVHSPIADAAFTAQPARVLALLTADCLPIVLARDDAQMLAVIHAGWRGLAAGIIEATLTRARAAASGPGAWRAWIGPSISAAAYEVGEDVRSAFRNDAVPGAFLPRANRSGKWWCNLPLLARHRLTRAGVEQVQESGYCTVQDARFYSYRRDGTTGRFATLAWLE